jgi:hypothetical protein
LGNLKREIKEVIKKTTKLDAGQHLLKLVINGDCVNLDKMVFKEIKR